MFAGPRPERDETISFDPASIGPDLDAWLAASEAKFPAIRPGAQKEIVWADPATRGKTKLAVIYLHGFSATKMEIRPVPDKVAAALGANLFFTRLTGHGQDGPAMADGSMNAWINDVAEALAIGSRIGERVVVIGTSTGGTLAAWAASKPEMAQNIAALALVSPNFAIQGASIGLLNMPWADRLLPMVLGQERSFEPHNAEQAKWWTTSYPSRAVFPMGALLQTMSEIDPGQINVPAIFFISPDDKVVVPAVARKVQQRWGGPKKLVLVQESGDPSNHVLAGDILSPGNTEAVTRDIVEFVQIVM
ncbi:MAG TPA: alpha/beta fold hydrolase [Rhizobiaceae bacterium]|nr:alpha/beta fold hydrolase [Rhizobiaceae bacterium]